MIWRWCWRQGCGTSLGRYCPGQRRSRNPWPKGGKNARERDQETRMSLDHRLSHRAPPAPVPVPRGRPSCEDIRDSEQVMGTSAHLTVEPLDESLGHHDRPQRARFGRWVVKTWMSSLHLDPANEAYGRRHGCDNEGAATGEGEGARTRIPCPNAVRRARPGPSVAAPFPISKALNCNAFEHVARLDSRCAPRVGRYRPSSASGVPCLALELPGLSG